MGKHYVPVTVSLLDESYRKKQTRLNTAKKDTTYLSILLPKES